MQNAVYREIMWPQPNKQQVEECTCNDALTRGPRPAPTTINTLPHMKNTMAWTKTPNCITFYQIPNDVHGVHI